MSSSSYTVGIPMCKKEKQVHKTLILYHTGNTEWKAMIECCGLDLY